MVPSGSVHLNNLGELETDRDRAVDLSRRREIQLGSMSTERDELKGIGSIPQLKDKSCNFNSL